MRELQVLNDLAIAEGRPVLALTKTSRKGDEIQAELEKFLTKLVAKFEDEMNTKSFWYLKKEYGDEVRLSVSKSVERAYIAGLEYADKALGAEYPLSKKDIENMQKITDDILNRFWGLIEQLEPNKVKEFSFEVVFSFLASLASDMVTKAINTATLSEIEPDIEDRLGQVTAMVEFVTRRDDRVCLICEPLDGLTYMIDDDIKPVIPDDTHPRCRCRYLIHRGGEPVIG